MSEIYKLSNCPICRQSTLIDYEALDYQQPPISGNGLHFYEDWSFIDKARYDQIMPVYVDYIECVCCGWKTQLGFQNTW